MNIILFVALLTISTVSSVSISDSNEQPQQPPRYLSKKREQFRVIYEWNSLNFTWPSHEEYQKALNTTYIPKNVLMSGIKIHNDKMYVTLPRIKDGVPATMAWIKASPAENDTNPLLNPFPSWEMNVIGDCRGFQSVQNFEIDLAGSMWVIDNGKTSTIKPDNPYPTCPPSITIINLDDTKSLVRYIFPSNVAGPQAYLNDLVIDESDGGYAYITDNSGSDPGIIVFDRKENRSWKFRDTASMLADPSASHFSLNGTEKTMSINIDGIALGPRFINVAGQVDRIVFFSPLSSFKLFAVPTSILRNETLSTMPASVRSNNVKEVGTKSSQTDGMIMDEEGVLYYGLIGDYAIAQWDSKTNFTANQEIIAKDRNFIQWVDRFAFDTTNNLYVVINRLHNYVADKVNVDDVNYRILRTNVGTKSYLYSPMLIPGEKTNPPAGGPNVRVYNPAQSTRGSAATSSLSMWSMILCMVSVYLF